MRKGIRLRKGRILLFALLFIGGCGAFLAETQFKREVTRFRKEFYPVEVEVEEPANILADPRLLSDLDDLPFYRMGTGYFAAKKYYVEFTTSIQNNSPVKAKFLAYHWIETIQETYWGDDFRRELEPGETITFSQTIELPLGKNTRFPNRNGIWGCYIEPATVKYLKTENRCKWVAYTDTCYAFQSGCKDMDISQLSEECDPPPTGQSACGLEEGDFPKKGRVRIELNLREQPAFSPVELKNGRVITVMDAQAEVTILGIGGKSGTINGRDGKWLKIEYVNASAQAHLGYAWCWNIDLID